MPCCVVPSSGAARHLPPGEGNSPYPKTQTSEAFAFWRGRFGRIIQAPGLGPVPDILPNKDERAIPANKDDVMKLDIII